MNDELAPLSWIPEAYGVAIATEKLIHAFCEENDLDYEVVYKLANITYNLGFSTLDRSDVIRPVLTHMPGPCGGHCVVPNFTLLNIPHCLLMGAFDVLVADNDEEVLAPDHTADE